MERRVTSRIRGAVGLAAAVVIFVGCATARVENAQEAGDRTLPRPARVVVFDFDTGAADVRVGSSPRTRIRNAVGLSVQAPDLLGEAVADTLATRLVEQITALGLPAVRAAGADPPGVNDLIVMGQFVRIDEGSMGKRFVIGFGAGATEVRTQVEIFQVRAAGWQPVQQFDTVATGSRMPGAAVFVTGGAVAGRAATSAAISTGVGAVRELFVSIDADARRTAEQITARVSDLSTAQRWQAPAAP